MNYAYCAKSLFIFLLPEKSLTKIMDPDSTFNIGVFLTVSGFRSWGVFLTCNLLPALAS